MSYSIKVHMGTRLYAIAKMVESCNTVCDIGSDHAYIPIYLVLSGICKKAIASDIKDGPVSISQKNIEVFKLSKSIEARKGFGLDSFLSEEIDAVIIAGMGGLLIIEIMEKGMDKLAKAKNIVLQPLNHVEDVRKWIYNNNFDIIDETLCRQDKKIYNIISTKIRESAADISHDGCMEINTVDLIIGSKLIEKKDPLLIDYINERIKRLNKIICGIRKSRQPHKQLYELERLKIVFEKVLLDIQT